MKTYFTTTCGDKAIIKHVPKHHLPELPNVCTFAEPVGLAQLLGRHADLAPPIRVQ